MHLKRYSVLALAFALPLVAGRLASGDPAAEPAAAPEPVALSASGDIHAGDVVSDGGDKICAGGAASSFEVRLEPRESVHDGRGERLGVDLEVDSHLEKAVRLVYSIELVDDRGRQQVKPLISRPEALEARGGRAFDVQMPSGLKAGFYRLRSSVAADTGDRSERVLEHAELFFKVGSDGVVPLSQEEFILQSNANLAFRISP